MKLLIVSAAAGAGHTRAAEALAEAARARWEDADVLHVDVLDFASTAYKRAYVGGFLQVVHHAPALWGYLYAASDDARERDSLRQRLVTELERLELVRFRRFVREFGADAVVATHFLPAQVLAAGRAQGADRFPFGVVLTDFDVHAFWVQPTVDRSFVATEEMRAVLAGRGVDPARITVSGIPIARAFSALPSRTDARAALGVAQEVPTVLVMGGGVGVGAIAETVEVTLGCAPVHVLAVAGRNDALREELARLEPPPGTQLSVFGYTDRIPELMAASDLAVTKSGGLTTSECLAAGLPMVVRDPIPGQEERNCDVLLEAGAGLKAHGVDALRFKLRTLLADHDRRARMSVAARAIARPDAADRVWTTMLG